MFLTLASNSRVSSQKLFFCNITTAVHETKHTCKRPFHLPVESNTSYVPWKGTVAFSFSLVAFYMCLFLSATLSHSIPPDSDIVSKFNPIDGHVWRSTVTYTSRLYDESPVGYSSQGLDMALVSRWKKCLSHT